MKENLQIILIMIYKIIIKITFVVAAIYSALHHLVGLTIVFCIILFFA